MNRIIRTATVAASVAALASLAACGSNQPRPAASYPSGGYVAQPTQGAPVGVIEYGRVSNIEVVQGQGRSNNVGAGAVIGAVVGGVLGNQIGGGTGRAVATGAGVVGGAVLGNEIENRNRGGSEQAYRVTVQLDRGGWRAYDVPHPGDLRPGDRVQVRDGQIARY